MNRDTNRLCERRAPTFRARLAWLGVAFAFLAGTGSGLGPTPASAAPPQLWQKCDADEPLGQQCNLPRGIAADPDSGHVFVADQVNRRVVDLTARGGFARAWGWDVVEGGGTGFEVCVPAAGDACKAGESGSGIGQFASALGVAVDSAGNVYVADFTNRRVQKFDSRATSC